MILEFIMELLIIAQVLLILDNENIIQSSIVNYSLRPQLPLPISMVSSYLLYKIFDNNSIIKYFR